MCKYGGPGEIRTPDLTVRSRSLYPTELRAPKIILLQGTSEIFVLSTIDLHGDLSFGVAFIPQWIENTSAFRPRSILSSADDLDRSRGRGSFTAHVGICHLFATYLGKPYAKRKTNLMSIPTISKK
jgi:hypothetical protein